MAQEYVAMSNKEKGIVAINTNVFESIAKICIDEEKDIYVADDSFIKNAIACKIEKNKLVLILHVKVKHNAKVNEVCSMLQTKIHETILHMTDVVADKIDIKVTGFVF